MFEFKKGDTNNLEGKLLVYAFLDKTGIELPRGIEVVKYPAMYASTSPLDIFYFKGCKRNRYMENIWQNLNNEMSSMAEKNNIKTLQIFCVPSVLETLDNIQEIDGDVLYAGRVNHLVLIPPLLTDLVSAYMINYASQLEKRIGVEDISSLSATGNYRDYNPEKLKRVLYDMVGRLMDAVNKRDEKEEKMVVREIRECTKGSVFFPDIVNLVGIARTHKRRKLDLISAYIDKIVAIYDENYEKAARLKKEIERMMGVTGVE